MDSKFDWSIRVSRIHFQTIHRDIFEKTEQFSPGFPVILMTIICFLVGCVYTICNYDAEASFFAAVTLAGMFQVYTTPDIFEYTLNSYLIIFQRF
jgi:hypothetical protein